MSRVRTNSVRVSDLQVEIRRDVPVPLHRQIAAAVRMHIRSGRLPAGTCLPPTRVMAEDLCVSRGVVVEAYAQLTAEGYLTACSGGYTEVLMGAHTAAKPSPVDASPRYRIDFTYGRADVSHFPRVQWLRSLRRVLTYTPTQEFALLSGRGAATLRGALADYLNRVRGTAADPDNIVITNGFAQGIRLLVQVLAESGASRLAMEDPAPNDDARPAARAAGLQVVGIPVDEDGLCTDGLDRMHADALVLAPSHQWPVGGALKPVAGKAFALAGGVVAGGTLVALGWFYLKAGAFIFGSGLAIVPFLREGVVHQHHWLTDRQFLDAVAMGLITPGPVVITATFIGYLTAGWQGALVATVAIFTPIFLGVVLPGRWFIRHRGNPQIQAFVKGATAAAAGAIAGAVVVLSRQTVTTWAAAGIAIATLAVLAWKVKEPYVVAAGAAAGLILHWPW